MSIKMLQMYLWNKQVSQLNIRHFQGWVAEEGQKVCVCRMTEITSSATYNCRC